MGTSALDADSARGDEANRLRVGFALLSEDASLECFGRVVVGNAAGALHEDGPTIVFVVGEVDRASAHTNTCVEDGLMDVQAMIPLAAERGQERGMDVQNSARKVVGDVQQLEEPRQANEVGPHIPTMAQDAFAELFARATASALDDERRDTRCATTLVSGDWPALPYAGG